jgi:prepilin-type N-terminal cleavage/methylation domain-containing protein
VATAHSLLVLHRQINMEYNTKNKMNGFTLVETLATIFVFGILMLGATTIMRGIFINSRQQTLAQNSIDSVRRVANIFTNELRNSTYGVNGAYPINQAGDTQIIFFTTAIKNDGTVSRVRYFMSGNTLSKGVTHPSGSPLAYTTETVTVLITNMYLNGSPLFYYYDGNYTGSSSALTQNVNINQVKYIKMSIIALEDSVRSSTNTFTVNAGVAIRNLKTNLGN